MSNRDWNPNLYLKFDKERTQPSIDLVSRINFEAPRKIIDIGCGPGNSTQILVQRWPAASVTGVDNSPAMIEKAKRDFPNQNWKLLDAGKDEINEKYDIVFSNAAIQWIPDHAELLKRFFNALNDDGLLAIQLPLFWDMPLGKAIKNIAKDHRWETQVKGAAELFTIHNYSYYYDKLSQLFNSIEMWETHYIHIMDSHFSILEMIRSTGLKPYLDGLEDEHDKREFEGLVLKEIAKDYPQQKNEKVLFPFKRAFFIANMKIVAKP
jgi:trans-aconitate 2-methyltransferase